MWFKISVKFIYLKRFVLDRDNVLQLHEDK